jgi:hypothetical protein
MLGACLTLSRDVWGVFVLVTPPLLLLQVPQVEPATAQCFLVEMLASSGAFRACEGPSEHGPCSRDVVRAADLLVGLVHTIDNHPQVAAMVEDLPHVMPPSRASRPHSLHAWGFCCSTLSPRSAQVAIGKCSVGVDRVSERSHCSPPGERPARPVTNPREESGKLRGCCGLAQLSVPECP